ncbi:hypothetical protein SM41311_11305 [Xanthomonas hortorum pv. gardneri]|nr:hypothetical protein BJD10_09055 [Xanthomonas hortorum pv. gardneri]KLB22936.1 hypothetical protein SM41311_11305 [Xanthomonas hortorum pv. gardneri]
MAAWISLPYVTTIFDFQRLPDTGETAAQMRETFNAHLARTEQRLRTVTRIDATINFASARRSAPLARSQMYRIMRLGQLAPAKACSPSVGQAA